jgi:hypothetical protein
VYHRWLPFLALASLVAGSACSSGHSTATPSKGPAATTTTAPPAIKVTAASTRVDSMRDPAPGFPDSLRDQVLTTLTAYVTSGVVAPLRTAQPSAGLESVFTPDALARLAAGTPERAALLEEPAGGPYAVSPDELGAHLVALVGQNGDVGLVHALVTFTVTASSAAGRTQVARTGDLVLVPVEGAWRIDSFDLSAKRDTLPPPTTTTGAPTTVKKK